MIPDEIHEVFQPFEAEQDAFKKREVESAVKTYIDDHPDLPEEVRTALIWEQCVWALYANTSDESSDWGTYFGPMLVFSDGEYPRLSSFTSKTIEYWKARVDDAQHPHLKARYADAVWDLAEKVDGTKPDHTMANIAIDNYVKDIANPGVIVEQIKCLERALYLAIKFNDQARVKHVCDAILEFHTKIAGKDKRRYQMFHFDALFEHRKKVKLDDAQWQKICAEIEDVFQLKSTPGTDGFDPLFSRDIGQRLIQYYRWINQPDEIQRIIRCYTTAIEHMTENAEPLFAQHWLQEIHRDFVQAGMTEDAEQIMPKIRSVGERTNESMSTISYKTEIPVDEMQQYCDAMTSGDVNQAMSRIAMEFFPRREKIEQQLGKITEDHPLLAMTGVEISDEFTRAKIGSVEDDKAGRLVHQMSFSMAFNSIFLHHILNRLFERYALTPELFVAALYQSPVFAEDRKQIFIEAIQYYRQEGISAAIAMLIPQIECVFRNLLAGLGGQITYLDQKTKTYREKDLGTVLNDPLMSQFWQKILGEDTLYFRTVLTEQRGLNLRNEVCHGLLSTEEFRQQDADILIHILLVLSLLRLKQRTADANTDTLET